MLDWLASGWDLANLVSYFSLGFHIRMIIDHASTWSLPEGTI